MAFTMRRNDDGTYVPIAICDRCDHELTRDALVAWGSAIVETDSGISVAALEDDDRPFTAVQVCGEECLRTLMMMYDLVTDPDNNQVHAVRIDEYLIGTIKAVATQSMLRQPFDSLKDADSP
jgi:hypothetical protein